MEVEETITEVIEKKKTNWFGHLRKMNDIHISTMLYEWELEGRIRRGQ